MSDNQTYRVFCLSEAVSPITHNSGTAGNESLVMREPVMSRRGVAYVPCLSGNAIRHRLVREPGMWWLVKNYGLAGQLTVPQLNFLFHGGNLTEGGGVENTQIITEMQRLWPLLRILGCCLPSQIIAGSLQAHRGMLVCDENRRQLATLLPDGFQLPDKPLRPAEAFVSGTQYTRGDATKTAAELLPAAGEPTASNLMIFSGQAVTRGALFVHGFVLPHASLVALGALLLSLEQWQERGATIGGAGSRGHGRLALSVHVDGIDPAQAIAEYLQYALQVKAEAVAWLQSQFAPKLPKAEKASKPAKGKPVKDPKEKEGITDV